ncbi:MAG: TM0106 family RecB-like putative nuclease, partial [Polyangiaceae bacterium]|nr:TM0106 family RecB-like putative nuclease [Polyangiaceae bacterium]
MKLTFGHLRLAASDITTFSGCPHATTLDRAVALGERPRPAFLPRPSPRLLAERGIAPQKAYLASLRDSPRTIAEIPEHAPDATEQTVAAMRRGVDIIYQGTLHHGSRWFGRADFLRRVDGQSSLGPWLYEPIDTKLARSAKAGALLQLCFYAELLAHAQGALPKRMSLVLGDLREEHFETATYAAYFRYVRRRFEEALATPPATYPEPVAHCDVCDYIVECEKQRRDDDHLSLVAGITTSQRRALEPQSVRTVSALAALPLGSAAVDGIGSAALKRIHDQARIQVAGRQAGSIRYELLPEIEPGRGLAMLPQPSPGDLFLDFEGDPYALGDGIEYLIGLVELPESAASQPTYTGLWAFDRQAERAAFERLTAFIMERRKRYPDLHVYHYNHYEPTALKRLAGRYATCVDELDILLRGKVFVDLYRVVRQGVIASVESYSIKCLEPLFGFTRDVPLREANRGLAAFEAWLELRDTDLPDDALRAAIEGYNRDDCLSAMHLREWLEARRRELEASGTTLPRPPLLTGDATEGLAEQLTRVRAVMGTLLANAPLDPEHPTAEERARTALAHLLEWHRREDKSSYWEYFRLCDLSDDELEEDGSALAGLTYEGVVGQEKQSLIHRYRFPPQDHAIDRALNIADPRTQKSPGTFQAIDDDAGVLDLKRERKSAVPHPTAVIPGKPLPNSDQRDRLLGLGEHVAAQGFARRAPFVPGIALLLRDPPSPAPKAET